MVCAAGQDKCNKREQEGHSFLRGRESEGEGLLKPSSSVVTLEFFLYGFGTLKPT